MAFIDYEKTFDSMETSAITKALRRQRVKILGEPYITATVKLHKISDEIAIQKGFRQKDTISPKLFTAVLEEVFKNLEMEKSGIQIHGEYQNSLRYLVISNGRIDR